jgi:hypothetical protein
MSKRHSDNLLEGADKVRAIVDAALPHTDPVSISQYPLVLSASRSSCNTGLAAFLIGPYQT